MGQLMSYFLLSTGWKITLFDAADSMNCSQAAAGLLTPLAELEKCDWNICQMGLESLRDHWPKILNQLSENIYFRSAGSLLIAHPHDSADMHRNAEMMTSKLKNNMEIKLLDQHALATIEPELAKFQQGYFLPDEGQLDNQQLLLTLKKYLLAHDVIWKNLHVTAITVKDIQAGDDTFAFDLIIDCRGLGAKLDNQALRGVRGELIWLHAPDVKITRPVRLAHPRHGVYIVPRPDHIYLIGASEIEAEDYSSISVQTMLELLSAAYYIHSGFSDARVLKTVTQCRPVLPHHRPEIRIKSNVISINGLYRHGFLIAPALAHEVVAYIERGTAARSYPEIWEQAA